jgi:hypothetical protein
MAGTVVQIKRSSTPGATPSSLAAGEFAINIADKIIFSSDGATVFTIKAPAIPQGFDTDVQFNDAGSSNGTNAFTFAKSSGLVSVGNSTVNTQINSSVILVGTVNHSVAANVGANLNISTTGVLIGNSTANSFSNSIYFSITNSTAQSNQTPWGFVVGTSSVNSSCSCGGRECHPLDHSSLSIGNTTANAQSPILS